MSIKGTGKELYIGKTGVNLITFMGNKVSISYSEMKRIDYCYAAAKLGYINFIQTDNKIIRFDFKKTANDAICRTIEFINQNQPQLLTNEILMTEKETNKSVSICPVFGYKELGMNGVSNLMTQRPDGTIYFNNNISTYYYLVGYEWGGPIYNEITKSTEVGKDNSTTVKKGKSLKIGIGALAGAAINPLGAVVGAAMGAGSKGKSNTSGSFTKEISETTKKEEVDTQAILAFENTDNKNIYKLSIKCNSIIDSKIKCFTFK